MRPSWVCALAVGLVACGAPQGDSTDTDASDSDVSDTDLSGDTDGGATCETCFLEGSWQIDNVSPCFVSQAPVYGSPWIVTGAVSSTMVAVITCPSDPTTLPQEPWSTDTLSADCAGHYRLCLTLKAGSADAPGDFDCVMATSCAEGDYTAAGVAQVWPELVAWIAQGYQVRCAEQFFNDGGYAVLSAEGEATGCGHVSRTFGRVSYCPSYCNMMPDAPDCLYCTSGQDGSF